MSRRLVPLLAWALLVPGLLPCAGHATELAALPFEARAVVPPMLVIAIDTDDSAATRSSWSQPYRPAQQYEGYFHHGLCYRQADGLFVPALAADASHYCDGKSWSGNFLNWAGMSALDTLRYALTGGARVTDGSELTVLERAEPARVAAASFDKTLAASEAEIARIAPLKAKQLVLRACGKRLQVWNTVPAKSCDSGASAGLLAELSPRVRVCSDALDQRPWLCQPYGRHRKPEGLLQAASAWLRPVLQTRSGQFEGRGLIGAQALASDWTRPDNALPEWDLKTGVLSAVANVLRRLSASTPSSGAASDAALLQLALRPEHKLGLASCQRNHAMRWPAGFNHGEDGEQQLRTLRRFFAAILREHQIAALPQQLPLAMARERSVFVARTDVSNLSSRLYRSGVETGADGHLFMPATAMWEASVESPAQRRIYTNAEDGRLLELLPDNLSASQLQRLNRSPYAVRADKLAHQRLEWLRNQSAGQEQNGGTLADRATPFASLAAGNLAYLDPMGGNTGGLLLISTGEGILHALDAATGREQFAWMPAPMLERLPAVSAPAYPALSLLDGGLSVASLTRQGRRVPLLAVAGGHSVRGVFALEMADSLSNWRALEFTDRNDERVGHVLHAPQVVQLATRRGNASVRRPFLLFSAGVGAPAALFLLALDQPAGTSWVEGRNYFHVPVGSKAEAASDLAPPAVVLGEDQRLLHVWSGDAQGRMWRFSFEEDGKAVAGFRVNATELIQAGAGKQAQVISTAARIAHAEEGAYMVLFGTGRWLAHADAAPGAARQESFYGVLDRPGKTARLARADLVQRKVEASEGGFRVSGAPMPADAAGWVIDFPQAGERVTQSPLLLDGRVLVTTRIAPDHPCQSVSQRSWEIDAMQGSNERLAGRGTVALLSTPIWLPTGSRSAPSAQGRVAALRTAYLDLPEPGKPFGPGVFRVASPSGRLAWREIANWSRLHEAAIRKP